MEAATEVVNAIVGADTAWMLVATALVLLMTPGVAMFYGGMVPARSVVSTKFQSFASLGIVGLIWAICGYSLVFSGDEGGGRRQAGDAAQLIDGGEVEI